jgi:hypothetical protein
LTPVHAVVLTVQTDAELLKLPIQRKEYAVIDLTPSQIQGLKLAKSGDLFPLDGKKWTHLNAEVTYAKHDRFKERPQKIKSLTTATLRTLRDHGLVKSLDSNAQIDESAHGITMAGKMWLSLFG